MDCLHCGAPLDDGRPLPCCGGMADDMAYAEWGAANAGAGPDGDGAALGLALVQMAGWYQ